MQGLMLNNFVYARRSSETVILESDMLSEHNFVQF